jgi:hypothetical protein
MSVNLLQQIQQLQFSDRSQAEELLIGFIRNTFSLDVSTVELRPLAVSLNSFNGFVILADGKRLFFKTHTEPDNVIGEYYNAAQLAKAGYPVIQPLMSSTEAGKQLLIYEVVDDPSVFDLAWEIEQGDEQKLAALTQAQNVADDLLTDIYLKTLHLQSATEAAKAPIHQLFYHRLVGGRLARFYGALPGQSGEDANIQLVDGAHPTSEVREARWCINGKIYHDNLNTIIRRAIHLLHPAQACLSVIGHGDAHNGNIFFRGNDHPPSLLYFDPAFAGRHHPLLDLTKPLFHNVFAMWMYFPQIKADATEITFDSSGEVWEVKHDYALPPVREMFLTSKVERTLVPILKELKARGQLQADWRAFLKASLFCCPFLTMNLADSAKFPPGISLLGLAMAVEMGAESSDKRSKIDSLLDYITESIN